MIFSEQRTIYQCWKDNKFCISASTEKEALAWLSQNGGGIFKNTIHQLSMLVKPDEFKIYHKD